MLKHTHNRSTDEHGDMYMGLSRLRDPLATKPQRRAVTLVKSTLYYKLLTCVLNGLEMVMKCNIQNLQFWVACICFLLLQQFCNQWYMFCWSWEWGGGWGWGEAHVKASVYLWTTLTLSNIAMNLPTRITPCIIEQLSQTLCKQLHKTWGFIVPNRPQKSLVKCYFHFGIIEQNESNCKKTGQQCSWVIWFCWHNTQWGLVHNWIY